MPVERIANRDLTEADIPAPDADRHDLHVFALTFDGYEHWGSFGACAQVANERRHDTLTELRSCLFFEQRRHHHMGYGPEAEDLAYWRELVEKIRQKVRAGEIE